MLCCVHSVAVSLFFSLINRAERCEENGVCHEMSHSCPVGHTLTLEGSEGSGLKSHTSNLKYENLADTYFNWGPHNIFQSFADYLKSMILPLDTALLATAF